MKRRAALLFALASSLLPACDGVGRSLVDRQKELEKPPPAHCATAVPSCDQDLPVHGSTLDDAVPALRVAEDSTCSAPVSELCTLDPELPVAMVPAPVEGGCPAEFSVDEDNPRELAKLACTAIQIVARGEAGKDRLVIEHASWQHAHVAVASARPLTVDLPEAELLDVRIELTGPVTLRLQQAELRGVQVLGRPLRTDAPELSVNEGESDDLTVRGETGSFPGRVALVRSTLRRGWLGAEALDLESVKARDTRIRTPLFDADDAALEQVSLVVDEGRAVASTLHGSKVEECGALTLIAVEVGQSVLGPCTQDGLRAYSVFAKDSVFLGQLESEGSDFRDTRFGTSVSTELVSWNSYFLRVALCSETQASFGENSSIVCSTCAPEASLCRDPKESISLSVNTCPLLVDMPKCKEPLDEPGRPH